MNTKNWTFDKYSTYVMACIVGANRELLPEDMKLLNSFLKENKILFVEDLVEDLSIVINYQTYEERINTIQEGFTKYITSTYEVELFLKLVEEIIISDLQVESGEMEIYRSIKKMIRTPF